MSTSKTREFIKEKLKRLNGLVQYMAPMQDGAFYDFRWCIEELTKALAENDRLREALELNAQNFRECGSCRKMFPVMVDSSSLCEDCDWKLFIEGASPK